MIQRIPLHPFSGGLWLASSDRAVSPRGTLRRAKNLGPLSLQSTTLRSRRGCTQLFTYPTVPHSLFLFANSVYAGVGTALYKDGSSLSLPSALDGSLLSFVKAPKTVGTGDVLYVAGGNNLLKSIAGVVSPWGVPAPADGFLALKQAYKTRAIETIGAVGLTLTAAGQTVGPTSFVGPLSPLKDLTVFDDGSASRSGDYIQVFVSTNEPLAVASITFSIITETTSGLLGQFTRTLNVVAADPTLANTPVDLTGAEGIISTQPGGITPAIQPSDTQALQRFYQSGFPAGSLNHTATRQRIPVGTDRYGRVVYSYVEAPKLVLGGTSTITFAANVWQLLLIPKNTFQPSDIGTTSPAGTVTDQAQWSQVSRIYVSTSAVASPPTSGPTTVVYFSAAPYSTATAPLLMVGGSPIVGTVKYRITEVDGVSGAESNPNPAYLTVLLGQPTVPLTIHTTLSSTMDDTQTTAVLVDASAFPAGGGKIQIGDEILLYTGKSTNTLTGVTRGADLSTPAAHTAGSTVQFFTDAVAVNVNRHPVHLQGIPLPSAGTNHMRLYRTMGNNEIPFKVKDLGSADTTFDDDFADFASIDDAPNLLSTTELEFDNIQPATTYSEAFLADGRMWWVRDLAVGAGHRLYYSPPGRYESVSNFLEITHAEDQLQKGVEFNGQKFIFSSYGIIVVLGDSEPFEFRRIEGCPGTTDPKTVVPTTAGIFYRAKDGLRLFNGLQSALAGFDALAPIFRGESVDGLGFFQPITATFARDELWISDNAETLIYNIANTWRQFDRPLNAVYYDDASDTLLGALLNATGTPAVWAIEAVGEVADNGNAIPLLWQTYSLSPAPDASMYLQRLYLTARTAGQSITPDIILDGGTVFVLPTFSTPNDNEFYRIELGIGASSSIIGVRFTGSIVQPVEIARVEVDIET